jgi:hypothetical protein
MDVIASYTPTEYEILLLDVGPDEAIALVAGIAERLRAEGAAVEHAGAWEAQLLGIGRRTLINRIERYGLPRPKK